jgi:hypothetical protein
MRIDPEASLLLVEASRAAERATRRIRAKVTVLDKILIIVRRAYPPLFF